MLDVYRKFYHFTGEPFRLGPDYRFSLHHSSYANAKAYLEYAIFQGEGFVTITGGPGTGKTTLISEILSVVDKDKIEVSTLTSTQLESRDLLHMVAHSFGIESEDTSKANLLLETESFLIRKIRGGQRAILIVDEAQGLSEGALEELRLLANLQYEYQLLLQIVLVGQEQLLELIQRPAMEHLRQRMVAATSLEPLDLDETINYIEHRLSRVAWKGDPGIEEGALQLVYRFSGGVPRRINLIMNRLFLSGGMGEKHQYTTGDMKEVIKGLVEEFLLPPDPLIEEADIEARHTATDAGKRPRYLPREPVVELNTEKPAESGGAALAPSESEDQTESVAQKNKGGKSRNDSRRTTGGKNPLAGKSVADMDVGSARRNQKQHSVPAAKAAESTTRTRGKRPDTVGRTVVQKENSSEVSVEDDQNKKKSGKGLFMVLLLLAGAGSAYLLRDESVTQDKMSTLVTEMIGQHQTSISEVDSNQKDEQQINVSDAPASGEGKIDRDESLEEANLQPLESVAIVESPALETGKEAAEREAAEREAAAREAAEREAAEREAAEREAAEREAAEREAAEREAAEREAAEREAAAKEAAANDASTPELAETSQVRSSDTFETQRVQLRKGAEQRFNKKQVSVQAKATLPSGQMLPPVIDRTVPPKKNSPLTANKIKQALLQGRWSSAGKPASLLPSESTTCREQSGGLACTSAPQNVKTQYGLALYKVETKLSEFSSEGHFELAYRTLVRLVDGDSPEPRAGDDAGWQVTEYAMSCTLTSNTSVSCLDGKGITREYRRASP